MGFGLSQPSPIKFIYRTLIECGLCGDVQGKKAVLNPVIFEVQGSFLSANRQVTGGRVAR